MTKIFSVLICVVTILLFCTCKPNESQQLQKEASEEKSGALDEQKDTKINTFAVVLFDDFRIRLTPDRKSKVIGQKSVGAVIQLTGEKGDQIVNISLRDVNYDQPFYEMELTNSTEKGWIYGGGILKIYQGNKDFNDTQNISSYVRFLDKLSMSDPTIGSQAFEYVRAQFNQPNQQTNDAIFLITARYLTIAQRSLWGPLEKMKWSTDQMYQVYRKEFDVSAHPTTQQLSDSGFELQSSEGLVYPILNIQQLTKNLPNPLSPIMQDYADLLSQTYNTPATADAGIIIPIDQIAERAVAWDQFQVMHPTFVESEQVAEYRQLYVNYLFNGSSNSPALSYGSDQFDSQFLKAWKKVAKEHQSSSVGKIAVQLLSKFGHLTNINNDEFYSFLKTVLSETK